MKLVVMFLCLALGIVLALDIRDDHHGCDVWHRQWKLDGKSWWHGSRCNDGNAEKWIMLGFDETP